MAQTKTLLANILQMSREAGLPDSEVGRAIDLYTTQLDGIMYLDEMQHVIEHDELVRSLRSRGVRAPGVDRGRGRPSHAAGPGALFDPFVPMRPPNEDGLDEMSMEDLQALIARAEAIKPV